MPNTPDMQDWEYQVADPARLDEFLNAYDSADLGEDERFCLMEIIIQSYEDLEGQSQPTRTWQRIENHLRDNFGLHAYTVWYWACFEDTLDDAWRVAPHMRRIYLEQSSGT